MSGEISFTAEFNLLNSQISIYFCFILSSRFNKLNKFELKLSNLRNYYFSNILAFGDCLHKIHPFAGQGLNMTIRDIRVISKIIQNKIKLSGSWGT